MFFSFQVFRLKLCTHFTSHLCVPRIQTISCLVCVCLVSKPFHVSSVCASYPNHFTSHLCVPHIQTISRLVCVCLISKPFHVSSVCASYPNHFILHNLLPQITFSEVIKVLSIHQLMPSELS